MDLLGDLNAIWVDCASMFLILSFLVFIGCLVWQHIKNQKEQKEIIANYKKNFEILNKLKNRF